MTDETIEDLLPDIPFLTPESVASAFKYRWTRTSDDDDGVFIHNTLEGLYAHWKRYTYNEYVEMWIERLSEGGKLEKTEVLERGVKAYTNLATDRIFILSHATGSKENISTRNVYLRQAIMFAVTQHLVREAIARSGIMLPQNIANDKPFPWYRIDFNRILRMIYLTPDSKPLEFSDGIFAQLDKIDLDIAWEQYAKEKGIKLPETSKAKAEAVVKVDEAPVEDVPDGLAGKFRGATWKNVHMKLEVVGGTRKKNWGLQIKHSDDEKFESYDLKDVGFVNLRKNEIKQSFHALRQFASINSGFLHKKDVAGLMDGEGEDAEPVSWKTFKMHISRLRADLKAAFGISEDPIKRMRDGTYAIHFGSLKLTDTPLKQSIRDYKDDGRDTTTADNEEEIVFYTKNFDQIADMSQTDDAGLSGEEQEQMYRFDADPDVDENPLWIESDDEQSDYVA